MNIVIVTCFVASVMLSLLINVFLCTTAIVKRVVLIFVIALYISLLLLLLLFRALRHSEQLEYACQESNYSCYYEINANNKLTA